MHFLLRDDKDVFKQIFYSNGELNTSLSSSAPLFTANIRRKLVCRLTGSLYPPAPRSALALRRARAEAWGRGRARHGTARGRKEGLIKRIRRKAGSVWQPEFLAWSRDQMSPRRECNALALFWWDGANGSRGGRCARGTMTINWLNLNDQRSRMAFFFFAYSSSLFPLLTHTSNTLIFYSIKPIGSAINWGSLNSQIS